MILNKLSIKGFGKLKNVNIDLKPGLNIIYGENESGKSTLLAFIKGIFYGLDKKQKKSDTLEFDRYEPWNSQVFAGMIEYNIDGTEYKVGRNFSEDKVSVCDAYWDDITNKFPKDNKNGVLFANEHLGMNEECFENTVFIRQLESRINEGSKELIEKLINMEKTGNDGISYRNAIELLESISKDKIGSSDTRKKPLNLINDEIDELEKQKHEVILLRDELMNFCEQIKNKEEQRDELIDNLNYNRNLKDSLKKQGPMKNYNKAMEYENNLEDIDNQIARLIQYENFPYTSVERLKEIVIELKNHKRDLREKVIELNQIQSQILSSHILYSSIDVDEIIHETNENFELLKSSIAQKDSLQNQLVVLSSELSSLESKMLEIKGDDSNDEDSVVIEYQEKINIIQNMIDSISQLKNQLYNIDTNIDNINNGTINKNGETVLISFEEMQKSIQEYKNIENYSKIIYQVTIQIEELESKIRNLENFKTSQDSQLDTKSEVHDDKLKSKLTFGSILKQALKKKLPISIISFCLTLLLLIYSMFKIITSFDVTVYISIGLGVLLCIFGIVNLADQLRDNPEEIEVIENKNLLINKNVKENKQNNIEQQVIVLEKELYNKKEYVKIIDEKYKSTMQSACMMFKSFDIPYTSNEVNSSQICNLENAIIEKANNASKTAQNFNNDKKDLLNQVEAIAKKTMSNTKDVERVLIELSEEKQKLYCFIDEFMLKNKSEADTDSINGINNIEELIELKHHEVRCLEENLQKTNEILENVDFRIKEMLSVLSLQYKNENIISLEEIEEYKKALLKISQNFKEVTSLKAIKNNIDDEIVIFEAIIKDLTEGQRIIFEKAMVTTEEEFFESYDKYSSLKRLTEEKDKVQDIRNQVLNGENSKEILDKVGSFQIASYNHNDEIPVDKVDDEVDRLNTELKEVDEEILRLKNLSSNLLNGKLELNQIVEKIEYLKEQKNELELKGMAMEVAIDVIKEVTEKIQKDFSPKFQGEMSQIVSKITDGKYTQVKANEVFGLNVFNPDTRQIVAVDKLSQGTIDQLYLGLRIALSNLIDESARKLPLILDEAFVQYDDVRLKNVLEFLIEESKERQILLFTCQIRELRIIKELNNEKNINVVDLV